MLALSVVSLGLTGCGSLEVSPTAQPSVTPTSVSESPKVEAKKSPTMTEPAKVYLSDPVVFRTDDPRYKRVHQVLTDLDFTSAGKIFSVNHNDGTNYPLSVAANFDDERTFQILSDRMKAFYGKENCKDSGSEEYVRLTCKKDQLEIVADNSDGHTSEVNLRVTDIAGSANWRPKSERKLTKSPTITGQTTTYNVANSNVSDLCSWDEGSDGSYEFKDIPCETHDVLHKSTETKMSVTVTDMFGKQYKLSSESTSLDPDAIDKLVAGILG
jgi:hypothetical protein